MGSTTIRLLIGALVARSFLQNFELVYLSRLDNFDSHFIIHLQVPLLPTYCCLIEQHSCHPETNFPPAMFVLSATDAEQQHPLLQTSNTELLPIQMNLKRSHEIHRRTGAAQLCRDHELRHLSVANPSPAPTTHPVFPPKFLSIRVG